MGAMNYKLWMMTVIGAVVASGQTPLEILTGRSEDVLGGLEGALARLTIPGFAFQPRDRSSDRSERDYERGMKALDKRQWDEAVQAFQEASAEGKSKAEGALYWKAYALAKLGRGSEATAALDQLAKSYPQSRWLNDAKALRGEIGQASGRLMSPEDAVDDEVKLMAINSLMDSDPERAIPLLQQLIETRSSPKLRERALFVLSQSNNPKAREAVAKVARGGTNPDLQTRAIHYLGIHGRKENSQLLSEVYGATNDVAVKKQILHAFMISGDRDRVYAAAKGESNVELRRTAVQLLGNMGAVAQLKELYAVEQAPEVKSRILDSLANTDDANGLIEIAKTEKDPKLQQRAIERLGHRKSVAVADALVAIYSTNSDIEARKSVLRALFHLGNATKLVEIARGEKNPELKKAAVSHLSHMRNKEATDFMMEILNR